MQRFTALYNALDGTTKINTRIAALVDYLNTAPDEDKIWAIALFTHRRPKRPVNSTLLRQWAAEAGGQPLWLFEESYHIVGDLAETIALLVGGLQAEVKSTEDISLSQMMQLLTELREKTEDEKAEFVKSHWARFDKDERFVFNKLLTGGFRIGVSQKMMVKALAKYSGQDENVMAHRLTGQWSPDNTTFQSLILDETPADDLSRPYPFYLTYPLEDEPGSLGNVQDWQAEWKWDGIRGQLIVRDDELFVWSRGEELVTEKFPEYAPLAEVLPNGTVIDGEVLAYKEDAPLNFQSLQTRIGRKNVGKKILADSPVVLMAYDLLEYDGEDIREKPMQERRQLLEKVVTAANHPVLHLSKIVEANSWEELIEIRKKSREYFAEGLMLKKKDSTYKVGRKRGDWWKWKVEPLTIDAVMIYAMRGHGRRANLYTDYTFAVWDGDKLVPFTKAYSGLTDAEFRKVDAFVKKNTIDKFGPVRGVKPELIFEIAFEGIAKSTRHKSGVALRFPRMKRWRMDKPASEANTLEDLLGLLEVYG